MSSQSYQTQIAHLLRYAAELQEALASRAEEVAVLRQEVVIAVEQRDTLALFLAPRRDLLEEDSHDLARDSLAIVEAFLGVAPTAPAPGPLSAPGPYHPLVAAAAAASAAITTTAAVMSSANTPSAPVSLASSPGPATPTPPRGQPFATTTTPTTTNTAAATAWTTASDRAAQSAELRRLGVMARSMEGGEEADMRDRGSPVPRNRAARNWVCVGGVGRGGVWEDDIDVRVLPPPRLVWPAV
ncbi:hypothetical protein MMC11_006095 [Xylographa trunciseda]|nr:hypothetical protein [Xylographa trunciseda]